MNSLFILDYTTCTPLVQLMHFLSCSELFAIPTMFYLTHTQIQLVVSQLVIYVTLTL